MVARSVRDAEVVGSNPVASTKTGLGRILRPFFMPRTSVICVLENSLVFALESAHSAILLPGLVDGIFIR